MGYQGIPSGNSYVHAHWHIVRFNARVSKEVLYDNDDTDNDGKDDNNTNNAN